MRKAKDLNRIRISLYMILATATGCLIMIIWGKWLHSSGDTLTKRGLKWEKDMQALGRKERGE